MQTREERINELEEIIKNEEKEVAVKLAKLLQPYISHKVVVAPYTNPFRKRMVLKLSILDENNEEVFGSDIDIRFEQRTVWDNSVNRSVETQDSYLMEMNYGTIGDHTRKSANGAYKDSDILIGKCWELEDEIAKIYNEFNWNESYELDNLYSEKRREEENKRIAEREEKERQEKLQLDAILECLREGQCIENPDTYYGRFTIAKIGRKNITLDNSIYIDRTWKKYLDKYELARYILNNNLTYKED